MSSLNAQHALHLLTLHPSTKAPHFLNLLQASASTTSPFNPLFVAQPQHIVIRPSAGPRAEPLSPRFDLAILLPASDADAHRELAAFPATNSLRALLVAHYVLPVEIRLKGPSKADPDAAQPLSQPWAGGGAHRPPNEAIVENPPLGAVRLTPRTANWLGDFTDLKQGQGSVSMLTLAAFGEAREEALRSYERFADEAAQLAGTKGAWQRLRGIVGTATFEESASRVMGGGEMIAEDNSARWDCLDLVEWPSVWHWAETIASNEYARLERDRDETLERPLIDFCVICMTNFAIS